MLKTFKNISLVSLVVLIAFFSSSARVEAFSLGINPLTFLRQTADTVTRRVSDIIYYLVMQKKYILDHYSDPNNISLDIPANFEKKLPSAPATAAGSSASNKLITVTASAVPEIKKTSSGSAVKIAQPTVSAPPVIAVKTDSVPNAVPPETFVQNHNNDSQILILTNNERSAQSLKPLSANSILDTIAEQRADDLFANQYFEHASPDGKSATDLAKKDGYEYLLIGENLALGEYLRHHANHTAMMSRTGNRANMLNGRYAELGVSVKTGTYNGENTTIAVQIFGLPLSDCPRPDSNDKTLIDSSTASIKQMQADALVMFNNLNTLKNSPNLDLSYYYQKIQEYNYFAKKVNDAVSALKGMIDSYNLEVSKYNSCVGSN